MRHWRVGRDTAALLAASGGLQARVTADSAGWSRSLMRGAAAPPTGVNAAKAADVSVSGTSAAAVLPTARSNATKEPLAVRWRSGDRFANESAVVVLFTNSAYAHMALNAALHLRGLGAPHVVLALTADTAAALAAQGVPVHDVSAAAAQLGLADGNFRSDYARFRAQGYLKVTTAVQLMRAHAWRSLVLSDTDVVWLRHPGSLLALYPDADLLVSTDCLSPRAVAQGNGSTYRCGMTPGGWNSAWNTGVVGVRNKASALAGVQAWVEALAPGAPTHSQEGWWIDDQLALTQVLDSESLPWQAPLPRPHQQGRSGLVLAWHRRLQVLPLPPLIVANGHVFLEQRLPELLGTTPYALHMTFSGQQGSGGKVARLQEANLWLLPQPLQDNGPATSFVTYTSEPLVDWLHALDLQWQRHTGRPLAALHRHLLGAAWQLQVFTEALAAARVLHRVLVPPRWLCWCAQDQAAYVDMLHACAIAGSDRGPPLECTADAFLSVTALGSPEAQAALRLPGFLASPEMRQAVEHSSIGVQVLADSLAASRAGAAPGPVLPLHVSQSQLAAALSPFADARLLQLGPLAPGWFRGPDAEADAWAVLSLVANLTDASGWCCLLVADRDQPPQDMAHAFVPYQRPSLSSLLLSEEEFAAAAEAGGGSALWQPSDTLFARPAWCEGGYLQPFNRNVSAWPNHPCAYLRGVVVNSQLKAGLDAALGFVHGLRAELL